jgi:Flp pilus assembly protein TadB
VTITITAHGFNPFAQLPAWLIDTLPLLATILCGLAIAAVTVLLAAAVIHAARQRLRRRRLQRQDS